MNKLIKGIGKLTIMIAVNDVIEKIQRSESCPLLPSRIALLKAKYGIKNTIRE